MAAWVSVGIRYHCSLFQWRFCPLVLSEDCHCICIRSHKSLLYPNIDKEDYPTYHIAHLREDADNLPHIYQAQGPLNKRFDDIAHLLTTFLNVRHFEAKILQCFTKLKEPIKVQKVILYWRFYLTLGDYLFSKDILTTKMTGYHDFNYKKQTVHAS